MHGFFILLLGVGIVFCLGLVAEYVDTRRLEAKRKKSRSDDVWERIN